MADEQKAIDLSFPLKGFDENWAYKAQPPGTSPDCLNVRAYDPIRKRLRGGQRPGLSKVMLDRVNGANAVQKLGLVMLSRQGTYTATAEPFTQANGVLATTNWSLVDTISSYPNIATTATQPVVSGNKLVLDNTLAAGTRGVGAVHKTVSVTESTFSMSADVTWVLSATALEAIQVGFLLKVPMALSLPLNTHRVLHAYLQVSRLADGGIEMTGITANGCSSAAFTMTPGSGDYTDPAWWTTARTLTLSTTDGGVTLTLSVAGTVLGTVPPLHGVPPNDWSVLSTGVGFELYKSSHATNAVTFDNWTISQGTSTLPIHRTPRLIAISGGAIHAGTIGALAPSTNTTGALATTTDAALQPAFSNVYFCDGTLTGYKILDPETNVVSDWQTAVTAFKAGSLLPSSGTHGCRIMALYRGRIVLSGLTEDPQNWFMSAAGRPTDWDYSATPSAAIAVAGNNTPAVGLVGDLVTCLAPWNDDILVIGGDHTLWIMRGDPADGGRIDNLSNQVGIAGPDAYAFSAEGVLYFFGNGILWRLAKNGEPEPVSRGRMDRTFGAVDLSATVVRLLWDDANHGLHIFFLPISQGTTTHYFWDARVDGFFPQQFPAAYGPACTTLYDADEPADRALLLGGFDGYVRKLDDTKADDDSVPIVSRVKFGPLTLGTSQQNTKVRRITTILDSTSNPVSLRAYSAQSPEEVVIATTPVWSGQVSYTHRYSVPRLTGNSVLLELKNDSFSAAWVVATSYVIGSQVIVGGVPYVSKTAHTSTAASSGAWVTGTDYVVGDVVIVTAVYYRSLTVHTSTTGGAHETPPGNTTDWVAIAATHETPPGNATDWAVSPFWTWALENLSVVADTTGRTRHGRI